jgi:hypothetical protein
LQETCNGVGEEKRLNRLVEIGEHGWWQCLYVPKQEDDGTFPGGEFREAAGIDKAPLEDVKQEGSSKAIWGKELLTEGLKYRLRVTRGDQTLPGDLPPTLALTLA